MCSSEAKEAQPGDLDEEMIQILADALFSFLMDAEIGEQKNGN